MSKLRIGIGMGHTLSGEGTGSQGCDYKEQNLTREHKFNKANSKY